MQHAEDAPTRRERMAILARADAAELESRWRKLAIAASHRRLKGPETGMVALRGRIGGGGDAFQFGEATLSRAIVALETGEVGHAHILGRDKAKAELCALIDALAQTEAWRDRIDREVIEPLRAAADDADRIEREKVAATKVDFFTLVRGED